MYANYFCIVVISIGVVLVPCLSHRQHYLPVEDSSSRYSAHRGNGEAIFRGDAAAATREKVVPTRAPAWNFNRDWDHYNFRSDRSQRSQFVRSFPEENKYRSSAMPDSTDPLRYYWPNRFYNPPTNRLSTKSPVLLNNSPRVRPLAQRPSRRFPCNSILCPAGKNDGYGYTGLEDATSPRSRQPFREKLQVANCSSLLCASSSIKR